ncbi:MAG: tRNA1(Val) (adenine(37)-N6)-methyltransferase [Lachnospiraceae bacterium]|nr:tRNA1(Val) (adenine(37)-N6)-methyltransferase [Lachnospiraceae bacterium]MBR3636850.1 tRNA1(Val) (adenine(37)-N6)-methyltransferase [Lachnospiraceae bacterium]
MKKEELLLEGERIDSLQRNGYEIIQHPGKFCFGMDAVLLSVFAKAMPGEDVLDLCTGTGVLPLLMSAKTEGRHYCGLEIQPDVADMAKRSVILNGLEEKIDIICGDLKEAEGLIPPASFDVVTCNPPYMAGGDGLINPADTKAVSRHEICCTLMDVLLCAKKFLKPGGRFYMVHRPFRLAEICIKMSEAGLEAKSLRMVYPKADKEPNMILIEGKSGAKSGMKVLPPLIIMDGEGKYTKEVADIYLEA